MAQKISVALAPGDNAITVTPAKELFVPKADAAATKLIEDLAARVKLLEDAVNPALPELQENKIISKHRGVGGSGEGTDLQDSDWGSILRITSGATLAISEAAIDAAPLGALFIAAHRGGHKGDHCQVHRQTKDPDKNIAVFSSGHGLVDSKTIILNGRGDSVIVFKVAIGKLMGVGIGAVSGAAG